MKCGRLGLVCLFAAVLLAHCAFEAEARTKLRFRSQDLKPRDEIASVTLPTILMESQATVTVRGEEDDAEAEQAGTAMDEETDDAEGEAEMEAEEERNAEHQAGVKPALLVAAGLADQPEEPAGDDDLLAANPVGDALLRNFENAEAGPGPAADAETAKDESEENPTAASPSAPAAASEAKPSAAAVSKDPNQAANSADEEEVADTKASKAVPAAPAAVPKAAEAEHKGDDADDVTSIVKTNHAEEDEANPESVKEAAALKAAEANARAPSDESAESDNFYPHLNSAPHRHAVSQNGGSPLERLLNDPDDINWYDNAYSAAYPAAVKASADAPNVHDAHRFKAAPAPAEAKKSEESSEDADDDDENSEESSEGGAFAALKVFKFSKDHSHGAAPAPATAVPANKLKGGLATGVTRTQNAAKVGENSKDEAEAPKPKKPKIPPHSAGTDRELNELEVAVKQEEDRALAEAAKQKPSAKASKRSSRSKSDPHGWSKEFPDLSASIATSFLQLQQKIRAQKKDVSGDDFASLSPAANPYMTGASLAYASSAFGSMEDLAESAALDLGDISTSDLDFDLTPRSRHHRFRALAPTGYQAPVPPTPTGYQAPVTPTPTPTTPASGYQGPTPPPTPPPAPYGGPVPPYGGPVPPYGAPVPPPPAPYGGKVPPYGGPVPPYGGPVPPPPAYGGKPPGYGGQIPPPPYGGYMGGYQGKVQVPVDKLPTFGIPAEYMAAFKKGALVLLRGPPGPKGDQGIQGPTGSVNATVLKEIASLKKKIEKIKNNKVRMEAIERKVYPFWAAEPYACPDEWLNLGYVESEQRIFCRPPEDGSNVGNPACRSVAKFPKRYDRCTWSIHCQVEWKNYGCWPFGVARPKEYTDAQESKIPQLVVLPGQDGPAETPGHPKMIPNFVPVMPTSQADELKLAQDIVGRVLNPTADPLLVSKPKGLKLPPQWNPTDANTDRNLNAGGL